MGLKVPILIPREVELTMYVVKFITLFMKLLVPIYVATE